VDELAHRDSAHRGARIPSEVVAALPKLTRPSIVVVGTFDGVHRGHREVLRRARALAWAADRATVAVTFDPRPDQVFSPGKALPNICTIAERSERLRAAGVARVITLPFSLALAAVPAQRFVNLLVVRLRMTTLCVGADFALGRNREGDPEFLRRLGLDVVTVPVLASLATERKASSSHVRQLIAAGVDPELALRSA
jgi:riboflavin kinase / FMN adenylyltransferase